MANKKLRITFYSLWIIIALVQALCIGLNDDEAYYWRWSQQLAWGYFDHPPMIAFQIGLGYFLLKNLLGVRIVTIIFSLLSVCLLECLIKPKKLWLFYTCIFSALSFAQFSYLTKPEVPLMFFSLLFFHVYRLFTKKTSLPVCVALGLCMGFLVLSKLTGVLVILFTVLSNLKLLKSKFFWLATVVMLLIVSPHLLWQFENSFPSLKFHAVERSDSSGFSLVDAAATSIDYFTRFLSFGNCFISILFIYAVIRIKAIDKLEFALKVTFVGISVFFWIVYVTEKNLLSYWLNILLIPGIYFGCKLFDSNARLQGLLKIILPISLIVLIFSVLFVIVPQPSFLPSRWNNYDPNTTLQWSRELSSIAGTRPVVSFNEYGPPGEYTFYTGIYSCAYNDYTHRKDQYDVWSSADHLRGKDIVLVTNVPTPGFSKFTDLQAKYFACNYFKIINNFQGYTRMDIVPIALPYSVKSAQPFTLKLTLKKWNEMPGTFHYDSKDPSYLVAQFLDDSAIASEQKILIPLHGEKRELESTIIAPKKPGKYKLFLFVSVQELPPSTASDKLSIVVD